MSVDPAGLSEADVRQQLREKDALLETATQEIAELQLQLAKKRARLARLKQVLEIEQAAGARARELNATYAVEAAAQTKVAKAALSELEALRATKVIRLSEGPRRIYGNLRRRADTTEH